MAFSFSRKAYVWYDENWPSTGAFVCSVVKLGIPWSSLAAVDEGSYRPNCRTHLGLVLRELSKSFLVGTATQLVILPPHIPFKGQEGGALLLRYFRLFQIVQFNKLIKA